MLNQTFQRLKNTPNSYEEEEMLIVLINTLSEVLDSDRTEAGRKKIFLDITKYLEKKMSPRLSGTEDELDYLKYVRNSLSHRKSIPDEAVRVAMPMFWRALREAATEPSWDDLAHLMSYALNLKIPLQVGSNLSLNAKIKKYEEKFNKLNSEEKIMMFRELLLSIYETPEFQKYLKTSRSRQLR